MLVVSSPTKQARVGIFSCILLWRDSDKLIHRFHSRKSRILVVYEYDRFRSQVQEFRRAHNNRYSLLSCIKTGIEIRVEQVL